jgi:ATP-dependent helicase HrpB
VQRTADLDGFWERSYPAIKADLKRRYPRHPWP